MRRALLPLPLVLVTAAPAWGRSRPPNYDWDQVTSADAVDTDDAGGTDVPDPPHRRDQLHGRWRPGLGVGIRFGTFQVNNIDADMHAQGHLDVALRKRRWWLVGEYAFTSLTLPADQLAARTLEPLITGDVDGLVHRLGAYVRYSLSRVGARDAGFDVYAEAGLGVQHLRWDEGGAWTRPDVSLGLGIGGWVLDEVAHTGMTLGLRITLAPRNDVAHARAICAGPCDYPTTPTGIDRSFLFDFMIPFGR